MHRALAVAGELLREALAERGADVAAALGDLADRVDELARGALLGDVAGRAGLQRRGRVQLLGVDREHEHRPLGELALQVGEQLEAAPARHGEVDQRHVPGRAARELEELGAVGGLAHDGELGIGGEELLQAVPHDRMVVCDEDSHRGSDYIAHG